MNQTQKFTKLTIFLIPIGIAVNVVGGQLRSEACSIVKAPAFP